VGHWDAELGTDARSCSDAWNTVDLNAMLLQVLHLLSASANCLTGQQQQLGVELGDNKQACQRGFKRSIQLRCCPVETDKAMLTVLLTAARDQQREQPPLSSISWQVQSVIHNSADMGISGAALTFQIRRDRRLSTAPRWPLLQQTGGAAHESQPAQCHKHIHPAASAKPAIKAH
jgi:hypothetical protein